jgi:N-acetylmuramoyl-L-alanine amidase
LNDSSIGIEIVNRGYEASDCSWSPFTEFQREALISLCRHLIDTYKIKPQFVLGHSDIAPGRKIDPGPLFPWKSLAEADIGLWPRLADIQRIQGEYKGKALDLKKLQKDLQSYGYNITVTGTLDDQTRAVVQAFHMHFLGSDRSEPTLETHITLLALLKRVE